MKQRYYQVAYKAYFAQFTAEQIINACADNKAMLAAYNITGDKAFLQAGSDLMRASAMASDLGL
ncbi:Uncharacterized protein AC499_1161 [Pseudomonas amygdali pv. lachrymans]|uniref:Uncharacterized protein n=1 Tax=Pseudomonas amygdali pv. lachrymans TaxID=53707 RepID=A0ABR5KQB3_PSEAV|nr:Uncharacterized protein AC499_0202 [Pseudomonas amygdali pv. lachrymans]KPC17959.1 Uncharacterized protein AC499_1161 [Pseudomonas amygdali pv. lachrymans]